MHKRDRHPASHTLHVRQQPRYAADARQKLHNIEDNIEEYALSISTSADDLEWPKVISARLTIFSKSSIVSEIVNIE